MQTNVEKIGKDDVVCSKGKDAWYARDNKNGSDMKQILKPILLGMAITGCYNFTDIEQTDNHLKRKSSLKSVASTIYRFMFFMAIFLFLCKAAASCFYISPELLPVYLQMFFWLLFNFTTCIIYLKATSRKYGHLEKVFNIWMEEIVPQFEELQIQFPETKINRRAIIALSVCIISVFFNVTGGIVQTYVINADYYVSPFGSNPLTLIVAFVFHTASSFIWVMSVAIVVIFTMFIKEAFNVTNQYVTALCDNATSEQCRNFDKIRRLHLNLCQLVGELDQDISWYFATSVAFNVGTSTFILYQIIRISLNTVELILFWIWLAAEIFSVTLPIVQAALLHEAIIRMHIYDIDIIGFKAYLLWLLICMGTVVVMSVFAALMHDAAHAPLDSIYNINVKDITNEKLAQLNMFLSKLTGTQVGFSTCGLLIITKEFILTIAGFFLTYFAVLYTL